MNCHGNHDILPVKDKNSAVAPLKVPFVCGKCHQEGTQVQTQRHIDQHNIIENYTESIHGEGLLKKGLVVAANCASCHTAHWILPHTDPNSSIARRNIAATCTKCHAEIERYTARRSAASSGRRKPMFCPPASIATSRTRCAMSSTRKGMADADCMRCHANQGLKSANGRSMFVNAAEVAGSRHAKVACSQCHSEVNASKRSSLRDHYQAGRLQQVSRGGGAAISTQHARAVVRQAGHERAHLPRVPRHPRHSRQADPQSPTFPPNVPNLCARCHREGQSAAVRYTGTQHEIISNYSESIHGKGLLKSGLTVTATCTSCHTAHGELPAKDPESTVNSRNLPQTCGKCHHGIEEQFVQERALGDGHQDRQTLAGVQRLPHRPLDSPGR